MLEEAGVPGEKCGGVPSVHLFLHFYCHLRYHQVPLLGCKCHSKAVWQVKKGQKITLLLFLLWEKLVLLPWFHSFYYEEQQKTWRSRLHMLSTALFLHVPHIHMCCQDYNTVLTRLRQTLEFPSDFMLNVKCILHTWPHYCIVGGSLCFTATSTL